MELSVDLQVPHTLTTHNDSLANWRRRTRIIDYCVDVLDASYEENKRIADELDGTDPRTRRKAQAELYSSNIKVSNGSSFLSRLTYLRPCVRRSADAASQRAHRGKDRSGEIRKRYEPCITSAPLSIDLILSTSPAIAVQVLRAATE